MRQSFGNVGIFAILLLLAAILCACGGGGGGMTAASGGTGGTGVTVGSISSFGSIEVNGVHYDTSDAEIFVEGQSAGVGDQVVLNRLSIGMIVRVEGDIVSARQGKAFNVYYSDDINGPVDAIRVVDAETLELTVLGQTVIIDDSTKTDGYDFDSLRSGEWVQVSGYHDAGGRIRASFAIGGFVGTQAGLKGLVTQLDTPGRSFMINDLVVDFQDASVVDIDQLSENVRVNVTGLLLSPNHLKAEKIVAVDVFGVDDAEHVTLAGMISEVVSDAQISLDGTLVTLASQTAYIGGTSSDIVSGVHVMVDGELINGIVYARTVFFSEDAKVESNVQTNNVGQSSLNLMGFEDLIVTYNPLTKVTGAVDRTNDINGTHHVKVIGRRTAQNNVMAVHIIVLLNPSSTVKLQGRLENDSPGASITVLGQSIDLSTIPDDGFEWPEGNSVGYTVFLNTISAGDFLSVKGELNGNQIAWQSIVAE